jgi:hypothetical protein
MTAGDRINSVVAMATVVMAVATFYLANVTRSLAKDAAEGMRQAERHHQDNLRPFCVLEFADADAQFPFGSGFEPRNYPMALLGAPDDRMPSAKVSVRGNLHNKGQGRQKMFSFTSTHVWVRGKPALSG